MYLTIAAILVSYVIGSVPTGLWLGLRLRSTDIRDHGSKNIGATNTLRVLGKGLGAVALLGDMAKGVIAVMLVAQLSTWVHVPLACGLAAIVGHTASVFLKFKGGKGVATSTGVFLGLCPGPTGCAVVVFALVFAITRMVSAGSILAAIALAVAIHFVGEYTLAVKVVATLVAVIVVVRHRSNVQRILKGTENRF